MYTFLNDLLDLPDTEVIGYEIKNGQVFIEVKSTQPFVLCKKCGKKTKAKGYGKRRVIRHLPMSDRTCFLVIELRRGRCEYCDDHPTSTENVVWCEENSRYTTPYIDGLMLSLINSTLADVAIKEDLCADTIKNILDQHIAQGVNWKSFEKIGLIGVDEISIKKGFNNYLTIISSRNQDKTRILGIAQGRGKAAIKGFLKEIPVTLKRTVSGICCDMHDAYINAAREIFKNVPVIVDRFHVTQLYRKCLRNVRIRELKRLRNKLTSVDYKALKSSIAILKRNAEQVTKQERHELKNLFHHSPKLYRAYKACRQISSIFNSKIGQKVATRKINYWIIKVQNAKLKQFSTFIKTLNKYKTNIVAYFKNRHTSGFVEGLNNKIKLIKRRCYGIFDKNSLFQRIWLDTEGYSVYLREFNS